MVSPAAAYPQSAMLDARVYRAAFLPLVLALFVVAFSLERRPPPATTQLAADAFNADRSFGAASPPPRDSLRGLAAAFPDRRPGSAGDSGLADRVSRVMRGNGFAVTRRSSSGRPVGGTAESETVIGIRPGVSDRRIVVVADRAAETSPAIAELSGTAALLELARVFRSADAGTAEPGREPVRAIGRDLRRTLVLVSTSGAGLGDGGPGADAMLAGAGSRGSVDAVLVLGDLAGGRVRKPWVVPWSNGTQAAPGGLRRTVEAAVRTEVGSQPGAARATAQWVRRALALTVSAQGEPAKRGLPAVLLSVSGERGPNPQTEVTAGRLGEFGRAALRAVSAVDGIGASARGGLARSRSADGDPAAFDGETRGIVTVRRVLPDWAVRLLIGAALLPALLAAFDGWFRVRRRRMPVERRLAWVAASALPFLFVYAWLRVLGATGALDAPAGPVLPSDVPVTAWQVVALASAGLVLGLAWVVTRRVLLERLGGSDAADEAGAAAAGVGLVVVATLVWVLNPYAAALLVPAAHLWLLVGSGWAGRRSQRFPSSWPAGVALSLGLALPGLAALYYAVAFGLGLLQAGWLAVLVTAGGHVTIATALVVSVLLGCLTGVLRVLSARGRVVRPSAPMAPPAEGRVRGPGNYAGPGSLGGTESALRR